MTRLAILGGSGYTALELMKILLRHPHAEVVAVTSRQEDTPLLALLARGVRVIDLSADYRLRDPNVYAQWYGESHEGLAHLAQAVYGLPELYGDEIPTAQLVANPGCYPQTAILGLAPLVAGKHIDLRSIIVDSKSGVSGGGRTPKLAFHFPECNESVLAYG